MEIVENESQRGARATMLAFILDGFLKNKRASV
jgi:hypothetical protein